MSFSWFYFIAQTRATWMMPAVISVIYALVMLLIFLILIPILGIIFSDELQAYFDKLAQQKHQEPVDCTTVLSILWICLAILTGPFWFIKLTISIHTIYRSTNIIISVSFFSDWFTVIQYYITAIVVSLCDSIDFQEFNNSA